MAGTQPTPEQYEKRVSLTPVRWMAGKPSDCLNCSCCLSYRSCWAQRWCTLVLPSLLEFSCFFMAASTAPLTGGRCNPPALHALVRPTTVLRKTIAFLQNVAFACHLLPNQIKHQVSLLPQEHMTSAYNKHSNAASTGGIPKHNRGASLHRKVRGGWLTRCSGAIQTPSLLHCGCIWSYVYMAC